MVKAALGIVCFFSCIILLRPLAFTYFPDFAVYHQATRTFLSGGNPYLADEQSPDTFLYPPIALLVFVPFASLPVVEAGQLFAFLSMICFLISVFILFRTLKIPLFSLHGVVLILLIFNFFPAKFTLGMGQFNMAILLLISIFLYAYTRGKHTTSGISLAGAISLKLFPVLPIFLLILHRQWKLLKVITLSLLVITTFTYLVVGEALTTHFVTFALPKLLQSAPAEYYNQSLVGFLGRLPITPMTFTVLRLVLSTGLLATSIGFLLKYKSAPVLLTLSHLITLNLLLNGTAWQHHYIWAIPPLLIVFAYVQENKLNWQYYTVLAISYLLIATNLKNPAAVPALFQSHVFYGGLLLYVLQLVCIKRTTDR